LLDLKAWVADLPDQGDMAWIFPSENLKTPLAKDNVWRRGIGPKLAAIGLVGVDFHVFRRTSASLMNDLGVEGKTVADQLGHTVDVSVNEYTRTFLKRRTAAVDTLENALKASRSA
jgi:integrase